MPFPTRLIKKTAALAPAIAIISSLGEALGQLSGLYDALYSLHRATNPDASYGNSEDFIQHNLSWTVPLLFLFTAASFATDYTLEGRTFVAYCQKKNKDPSGRGEKSVKEVPPGHNERTLSDLENGYEEPFIPST
jgi:hypothetical protein